jgi:PAS domain S-box-containing protein
MINDALSSPTAPSGGADGSHDLTELTRLQALVQLHGDVLDALPMQIVVYEIISRTDMRLALANRAVLQTTGFSASELVGKRVTDFFQADEAAQALQTAQMCVDAGTIIETVDQVTVPHGRIWLQCATIPLPDSTGRITRVAIVMQDITAQKQREEEERQHQTEIIQQQQATLAELSTPLLAISDTTVVMPLIGAVDSLRVAQMMDALLHGVSASRASKVILDITGVSIVDTQVANAFISASQAVSLLGAQVVLTGIRPEVAQTLVGLGVDLQGIITRSTLRDGIAYALEH